MTGAPSFRSLLYTEPHLYDLVFSEAEGRATAVAMCWRACQRYGPFEPRSVLDVGCGTARHLRVLAERIPECWGVDLLETNIAHARSVHPGLRLAVGDMRSVRLDRTFDLVLSFGNTLSYALTDADLAASVETLAVHARPGGLVMVDVLNARAYLDGDGFQERIEGRVDAPGFAATAVSVHTLDRAARILTRVRTWRIAGRPDPVEDRAAYRLSDPDEFGELLRAAGLEVLGVYDNRQLDATDLTGHAGPGSDVAGMRGRKLYAFARRVTPARRAGTRRASRTP